MKMGVFCKKIAIRAVFCYHVCMKMIKSATFVKGVVGEEEVLRERKPQIAFIGRSNVGKSSTINALTRQKSLARTSSFPGRTQQLNVFLINKTIYLVDLPGYGFAKTSRDMREQLQHLIDWYLFESSYRQAKVVLIIDANIGLTDSDIAMLRRLEEHDKHIVVVANKIDKIKKVDYATQLATIQAIVGEHTVIPYSAKKNIGVSELTEEILTFA